MTVFDEFRESVVSNQTPCPDCGKPITGTNLWGRVTSCACGWTIMGAMRDGGESGPDDE